MEPLSDILKRIRANVADRELAPAAPEAVIRCLRCKDFGWLPNNVPFGDPAWGDVHRCPCQYAEAESFDNFSLRGGQWPDLAKALQMVRDWTTGLGPPIIILSGERGVGKTHLAKAAHHALRCSSIGSVWLSDGSLRDRLHKSFEDHDTIVFMAMIETTPRLMIDDYGLLATSSAMAGMLDRIIDLRTKACAYGARTLITTNLDSTSMTVRTASRLKDVRLATSIAINAPDYRQHPHGER